MNAADPSRRTFLSWTITVDAALAAAAPVRRALAEAAAFLEELTGRPASRGSTTLELDVRTRPPGAASAESYGLGIGPRGASGLLATVSGSSPVAAARGISRLLCLVELDAEAAPSLPAALVEESSPRIPLRGMHLNGWAAGYPYAFRCWREQDWLRYVDILFHEGVNHLFLWPSPDIIPLPLSAEDEAYLREVRRVVQYAREERGMETWIMESANRVALSDCGVADPRVRPYWVPDVQVDLDPGRPDHLERILASREPLYRIVDNADAFVMIDSDPGGLDGSPVAAFVELFRRTRELIDSLPRHGPPAKLVSWVWQGWGHTTWDPGARGPVIEETVRLMRERLPGPWMLITGTGHYLPQLRDLGVLDRTVFMPYGAIEAEPSLPFTNVDPASIDGALQGIELYPGLAGAMGNVQCPLLQLPQVHHLAAGLWHGRHVDASGTPRADLHGLARTLFPGQAPAVAACIEALNATDPRAVRAALERVRSLAASFPRPGLVGRLLFPSPLQVLADLAAMLEVREAEAGLACALEQGAGVATLQPLVRDWFRQCLRWEGLHQYFDVLRRGRLNSLFARPPIPRETIRTWPPFVPYAVGLRAALAAAGDPRGESFFAPVLAELAREFDTEKVRRGCVEAMQTMMERSPA